EQGGGPVDTRRRYRRGSQRQLPARAAGRRSNRRRLGAEVGGGEGRRAARIAALDGHRAARLVGGDAREIFAPVVERRQPAPQRDQRAVERQHLGVRRLGDRI